MRVKSAKHRARARAASSRKQQPIAIDRSIPWYRLAALRPINLGCHGMSTSKAASLHMNRESRNTGVDLRTRFHAQSSLSSLPHISLTCLYYIPVFLRSDPLCPASHVPKVPIASRPSLHACFSRSPPAGRDSGSRPGVGRWLWRPTHTIDSRRP